jgi:hypothetical protein
MSVGSFCPMNWTRVSDVGIVELGGAAGLLPQHIVDVLEGLFEHGVTLLARSIVNKHAIEISRRPAICARNSASPATWAQRRVCDFRAWIVRSGRSIARTPIDICNVHVHDLFLYVAGARFMFLVRNERIKLTANLLNGLAIALIAAGAFAPAAALFYGLSALSTAAPYVVAAVLACVILGAGLHLGGSIILGRLRE